MDKLELLWTGVVEFVVDVIPDDPTKTEWGVTPIALVNMYVFPWGNIVLGRF